MEFWLRPQKLTLLMVKNLNRETVNYFYWPTNALNCIKLKRLKFTCINILKDN